LEKVEWRNNIMARRRQYIEEPKIVDETVNEESIVEEPKETEVVEDKIEQRGIVNCPRLNLRKEPNINSEVITVLLQNLTVIINDEVNDFYNVTVYIGDSIFNGYCMSKYITLENE